MPFHTHTLPNGMQIIGETNPAARSASVGFFVRAGSRDEGPEVAGVSHFLEHMVFKGTPRRTAMDVNLDFDRIGADYNAYTSEESTVFWAAVLPEYLPRAVDVLTDVLRPSLRGDDFDMEKQVILEEIDMYEDRPGFVAYDRARRAHFGAHPLGNSVLGTAQSVGALTRDQMLGYFDRRYVPSNILVSVAGNTDWPAFVDLIAKHCGDWKNVPVGREYLTEASGAGGLHVFRKESVTQEYVVMIAPGPTAESPLRYAADTLAVAVGDSTGSRLYWALIDPGLAESADMSYYQYEAAGSYFTSLSCEPENTAENRAIVEGVLSAVQHDGISEEELVQAKSKNAARWVRMNERPLNRMQLIASAWRYQHEYRDIDSELKLYEGVTLDSVREALDRYPIDKVTATAFGPLEKLDAGQ
jgi:predicted Zn-dependent peptidase